jgi:putative phosphoesterase
MKLLITGDIHGRSDILEKVLAQEKGYDMHLCTGDLGIDLKTLEKNQMIAVKGNNDYYHDLPTERLIEFKGHRILLTHGHLQNVKYGLQELIEMANEYHATICIFGHTHEAFYKKIGQTTFINPGALCDFKDKSYAIYEEGKVSFLYVSSN